MKLHHFFPLSFLLALSLTGCGESDTAAAEATTDTASVASETASKHAENKGIVCTKKSGPIETTTYLGLVTIDQTLYTGIRTDKMAEKGDKKTDLGSTLSLDDGKSNKSYVWNEGAKTGSPTVLESAFPPGDIGLSIEMGKRIYGDCKPWEVNPEKFQHPNGKVAS